MKVYCGFQICYNGCDQFENMVIVFETEESAIEWCTAFPDTEWDWRDYKEYEVMK